ncbi:MAG: PDZ domain-containing protein, partial [Pseudomonadota bacterium]|nr:PDZ domain-containing protein [Pseudomonadota bacterium]
LAAGSKRELEVHFDGPLGIVIGSNCTIKSVSADGAAAAKGLQAGDVITQINGLDLTDLQQSQEALSELRNAQTIELTIIRDGSLTTLYLDLPES